MDKISAAPLLSLAVPPVADLDRPGFRLQVDPDLGIAKLRVTPSDADTVFRMVAGFTPPPAGRQIDRDGLTFAWLAPGEWLITGPGESVTAWISEANDIGGDDVLAVDFTHARVAFELAGASARAAFAAHCPLDLWPEAFPVGAAARSLLGDTVMFIARLNDHAGDARFRIVVDQTMARYARRLFAGTD
jgi:sarcosine oxidase subunit gamma